MIKKEKRGVSKELQRREYLYIKKFIMFLQLKFFIKQRKRDVSKELQRRNCL